jgi:hypothetical protein
MSKPTRLLCMMCVLVLPSTMPAQVWVAQYDGPGNYMDVATAMVIDNAGNIYVTGKSWGSGTRYDYATVKYDASGIEQWVARYDGPSSGNALFGDSAVAIAVDNANNIYVTGNSPDPSTGVDYATVKYDASGVEQWVARYDGDMAAALAIDNAGNVCVTGSSESDYATVKYDSSGIAQWVARYSGVVNIATAVAVDNTGNIYVTGKSYDYSSFYDYATVKYDASGAEQWVARYGSGAYDAATAIAVDNTGNVYVTGTSHGSEPFIAYATVKYDSLGVEQWVARCGGQGDGGDTAWAIVLDNLGNIYVTGSSVGPGTYSDYATVKYDASGVEQWVARYDGPTHGTDIARALAIDDAGNVYITGISGNPGYNTDYATVKYDASGAEQWVARYDGSGEWDGATAIAVDNTGNVCVTGWIRSAGTECDYGTIKYSPTGIEENILAANKEHTMAAAIFCGPLQLPADKKCRVFDITGRVVDSSKIHPGIYFIEFDGVVTQKVVKIR